MGRYFISYMICDGTTGNQAGFGNITMDLTFPPRSHDDVLRLADQITDEGRQFSPRNASPLHPGQYVSVTAWSEMSD